MSVSGFTPAPSTTSATGTSPATSSSHQPPCKQLKALEGTEGSEDSPNVLGDTTDEELQPTVVPPVPNVPEDDATPLTHLYAPAEVFHEADEFVPNACRSSTLEENTGLTQQAGVEVVQSDNEEGQTKEEAKEENEDVILSTAPIH